MATQPYRENSELALGILLAFIDWLEDQPEDLVHVRWPPQTHVYYRFLRATEIQGLPDYAGTACRQMSEVLSFAMLHTCGHEWTFNAVFEHYCRLNEASTYGELADALSHFDPRV